MMLAVPALKISVAVIAACKLLLETKVVGRVLPFHCTVEVDTKPVPVTFSVNAVPPARAALGFNNAIVDALAAGVGGPLAWAEGSGWRAAPD